MNEQELAAELAETHELLRRAYTLACQQAWPEGQRRDSPRDSSSRIAELLHDHVPAEIQYTLTEKYVRREHE